VFALHHDSEYDVNAITNHFGEGPARFVLSVPHVGSLEVGFEISDGDTWNEDDPVCSGWVSLPRRELDVPSRHRIESPDGRCTVSFTVEPLFGSPVTDPGDWPPMPMLMVENLTVDEATGRLQIHVRNVGAAAWVEHDLDVAVMWPSGAGIGAYTWPDFFLPPGEKAILEHPDLTPRPPLGACVVLDPGNEVMEESDRYRWTRRGRYCRPLPDLTIAGVEYDPEGERLLIAVQNIGEGSLEDRTIDLEIRLPDGRYIPSIGDWYHVTLEPWETVSLVWDNVHEDMREVLRGGYTMVVDPYNRIAEESGFNNEYTVTWSEVFITWERIFAPAGVRGGVGCCEYELAAYVRSGPSLRELVHFRVSPEIDWDACGDLRAHWDATCIKNFDRFEAGPFEIAGDERLVLGVWICWPGSLSPCYRDWRVYGPDDNWGTDWAMREGRCWYSWAAEGSQFSWIFLEEGTWQSWGIRYMICHRPAE